MPPASNRSLARRLAAAGAALLLAGQARAQGVPAPSAPTPTTAPGTVVLHGRVVARATDGPVFGAAIVLEGDSVRARTDSTGAFIVRGLVPGAHAVIVRAIGFVEVAFSAELRAGASLQYLVRLDVASTAQELAPVTVTTDAPARPSYRLVDFERRRRTGRGQYLDMDEIEQSRASTLPDLTRGMRGVAMHCGGSLYGGGCRIQMVRAPNGCQPEYVVDGRVDNMFGGVTPVRDIIALEIYTGPSDVPGEFAGSNAGCGVVVIWTRSGPPRKGKEKSRG
jgi:hypothetical protein